MALKVGDKAPEFKLKDSFEKEVSLSDFKGKKIILYYYQKIKLQDVLKKHVILKSIGIFFKKIILLFLVLVKIMHPRIRSL